MKKQIIRLVIFMLRTKSKRVLHNVQPKRGGKCKSISQNGIIPAVTGQVDGIIPVFTLVFDGIIPIYRGQKGGIIPKSLHN